MPLLKTTAEYLRQKGVPSAKIEAEILLRHALGLKNRIELYTGFERTLTQEEVDRYRDYIRRRVQREPVSRIIGEVEFMGLPFKVTPEVFCPRPDTEVLVEEAIRLLRPKPQQHQSSAELEPSSGVLKAVSNPDLPTVYEPLPKGAFALPDDENPEGDEHDLIEDEPAPSPSETTAELRKADPELRDPKRILDLGTGSGCIAVSLCVYLRDAYAVAVDRSVAALTIARDNAPQAIWERIDFREGDWWDGCWEGETFDLIVSNPPYLVEGDPEIWPEARDYDPSVALYGGPDGLDFYRRIAADIMVYLKPGGRVLVEVGQGQHEAVLDLFATAGLTKLRTLQDHAGIERVVSGKRAG